MITSETKKQIKILEDNNMKRLNLVRQSAQNPDFDKLEEMLKDLKAIQTMDFEVMPNNVIFDYVREIVRFVDEDWSFKLVDSYRIESDSRVEYCHIPTYLCTAFLMKAFLYDPNLLTGKEDIILRDAMKTCMARHLCGHGYNAINGQIDSLKIFINAGLKTFIDKYSYICPEFVDMVIEIAESYRKDINMKKTKGAWGENYREDYEFVVNALLNEEDYIQVFVYGTLMKGRANYYRYLAPLEPITRAEIEGFKMYDIGYFPGIVEGEGRVKGEVYEVSKEKLAEIDALEGEGSLYIRKKVKFDDYKGNHIGKEYAYVYVYNRSVNGLEEISYSEQPYQNEYVWYVSYGSNMLEERFMSYILGGYCERNGREYEPCEDTSMPIDSKKVWIPYNMYYSNFNQGSWENSAVSFLDINAIGESYGRAYLIKKTQLEHIHRSEGMGRNWYPDLVELEDIEGIKAVTFTNAITKEWEPVERVSSAYLLTLYDGLLEMEVSGGEAMNYLRECGWKE